MKKSELKQIIREILNEDFTSIPVSLEKNEYYLDATFRKLYISIE